MTLLSRQTNTCNLFRAGNHIHSVRAKHGLAKSLDKYNTLNKWDAATCSRSPSDKDAPRFHPAKDKRV